MDMTVPTWSRVKHVLNQYDGAATEIFVVGISPLQLPVVAAAISNLPALEVLSYEGESLEASEPFDEAWRGRFESPQWRSSQHSLRSADGTARHLQVYLWVDMETESLEVEFVFWNDLTFPKGLPVNECKLRLQTLLSLADSCRAGVPGARCILAPEHNGPTAELLEKGGQHVIVW